MFFPDYLKDHLENNNIEALNSLIRADGAGAIQAWAKVAKAQIMYQLITNDKIIYNKNSAELIIDGKVNNYGDQALNHAYDLCEEVINSPATNELKEVKLVARLKKAELMLLRHNGKSFLERKLNLKTNTIGPMAYVILEEVIEESKKGPIHDEAMLQKAKVLVRGNKGIATNLATGETLLRQLLQNQELDSQLVAEATTIVAEIDRLRSNLNHLVKPAAQGFQGGLPLPGTLVSAARSQGAQTSVNTASLLQIMNAGQQSNNTGAVANQPVPVAPPAPSPKVKSMQDLTDKVSRAAREKDLKEKRKRSDEEASSSSTSSLGMSHLAVSDKPNPPTKALATQSASLGFLTAKHAAVATSKPAAAENSKPAAVETKTPAAAGTINSTGNAMEVDALAADELLAASTVLALGAKR